MKKIIFYSPTYFVGGTEVAILNLVKKIKEDYDIYIGYSDEQSDKEMLKRFEGYAKVVNTNMLDNIYFDVLITATKRYEHIDILDKIKAKKNILWVHWLSSLDKSVLIHKEACDRFDNIVIVSKTSEKELETKIPYIKEKLNTIYNVINIEEIIEKSKVPIKLDLSKKLNLVTVARISKEKGYYRMLELAKYLKEKQIDFKWFVIGHNFNNKESADEIIKQYEPYKENFEFLGFLNNPHNIVKQCDYTVLLSDAETWGLVLTEAMLLKVPCISTDFKVAYEQIQDGKNGIILSRANTESYLDRIDDIVNNKEKYKKAVESYIYDNEQVIKEWKDLLDK